MDRLCVFICFLLAVQSHHAVIGSEYTREFEIGQKDVELKLEKGYIWPWVVEQFSLTHIGAEENNTWDVPKTETRGEFIFPIEQFTANDTGKWVLTTTYRNQRPENKTIDAEFYEENDVFIVYGIKHINTIPAEKVTGYEGTNFTILLNETFNEDNICMFYHNEKKYNVRASAPKIEGMELYGKCGDWMLVEKQFMENKKKSGTWSIISKSKYIITKATFHLIIKNLIPELWYLNKPGKLILNSYDNVTRCDLVRPNGTILTLPLSTEDPFVYEVDNVSTEDAGIWKAYFYHSNMTTPFEEDAYKITVEDTEKVVQHQLESSIYVDVFEPYKSTVKKCEVFHVGLFENNTSLNITEKVKFLYPWNRCTFELYWLSSELTGRWIVTTKYVKDNEDYGKNPILRERQDFFNIYGIMKTKSLPTETVNAIEGEYVRIFMEQPITDEQPSQNKTCKLIHNDKVSYDLTLGGKNENISLYKECGVRMLVNRNSSGKWLISEEFNFIKRQAQFELNIAEKKNTDTTQFLTEFFGQKVFLHVETSDVLYCEFEGPDGSIIKMQDNCYYEIKEVNSKHAGVWIARYSTEDKIELVEKKWIITVLDTPKEIYVNVSKSEKMVNILCSFKNNNKHHKCLFEKPNGTIIVAPFAIGNNKYEYYGRGKSIDGLAECGLTINDPSEDDYGTWKCMAYLEDKSQFDGTWHMSGKVKKALVHVNRNDSEIRRPKLRASPDHIYVKKGDNLMINCSVDEQLDYCGLISPNGTSFTITNDTKTRLSLPYVGEGFKLGECSTIIKHADHSHHGNWKCLLGIRGGSSELELNITVTVTENYLIPSVLNEVDSKGKKSIKLQCRTFPDAKAPIKYCRWTRPNKHGISDNDLVKYTPMKNDTTCSVHIGEYNSEDVGEWMCFARLQTLSDQEFFSKVIVKSKRLLKLNFKKKNDDWFNLSHLVIQKGSY